MAKLEIPSIVVQSGSHTPPVMDRAAARTQWSMSNQSTYEEDIEPVAQPTNGETDHPPAASGERETEAKTESKHTINNNLPRSRSKANLKLLKRSHAIKESTSPPPDLPLSPVTTSPTCELPNPAPSNNNNNNNNNNLSTTANNNGLNPRPTIKREGSNQSTDSNWSSSLSRGNSMEQPNNEQPILNIEQFLADTINGHAKDRIFLLRIENDLINLIKDSRKTSHKFGMMSSYQRMLVHRIAHYYGLEHNVDSSGHMVVVSKGKSTKMPANKLNFFIRDATLGVARRTRGEGDDYVLSEEPRKSILKRDSASFEDTVSFKSPDRHTTDAPRRSKSFEEREEEYEKVRARIFHQEHGDHNHDGCSQDCEEELRWSQLPGTWERSESSDSTKLHPNSHRPSRLTKVESYESRDTLRANSLRSSVSKSYSFGGYDQTSNNRVLTKQDSGSSVSSRVSPSASSGYKSQSQRSDTTLSATPSPTATPHLTTQLSNQSGAFSPDIEQEQTVLWAVTNMSSVPVGSVLIDPKTGQPVKNEDGTLYHYDPDNPPKLQSNTESSTSTLQTAENETTKMEGGNQNSSGINNEASGSGEASAGANKAGPALPQTYPHHPEHEQGASAMPQMPAYHHMPPPVPAAPVQMPSHTSAYPTYHAGASYNVVMQPPAVDGYAPPPASGQPTASIIYGLPPTPASQQYTPAPGASYDRGTNPMENPDPFRYVMNFTHFSSETHPSLVYYNHQPAHFPQNTAPTATGPTVPVYFAAPPAAPAQPATHQPRYPPCAYQYQPADRPVECNYQQLPVHTYNFRCPVSTPQVGGAPASYCGPSGGSAGGTVTMGLVLPPAAHTTTARPYHRMPTPPNTPQNGCAQFPLYNNGYAAVPGCYQHYQAGAQSQVPLGPMMRPGMHQLNMGNSPPMRSMRAPQYNPAAARSPAPVDPARHSASPLRYSASVAPAAPPTPIFYRFAFPELLMQNNRAQQPAANRLQPSVPVPFSHVRRNFRGRPVGSSSGRPVFAAQAALASAIETAGHSDNGGGEYSGDEIELKLNSEED